MLAVEATWEDIAAVAGEKIAILPVGSCEQHGPHLPLGTDTIIAQSIAQAVDTELDAVVFPALNYGYRSYPFSGGGPLFPGTVDLAAETLVALAENVLTELIADGFDKILIINAHFENQFPLQEAMIKADSVAGQKATIVQANWWDPLEPGLIEQLFSGSTFPGWALEHGAVTETSLMLHLAPHLVRAANLPQVGQFSPPLYFRVPTQSSDIPAHGALADASQATASKGRIIVDAAVGKIVEIARHEFS